MDLLKIILEHPLYGLLFGSGGVLIIIISLAAHFTTKKGSNARDVPISNATSKSSPNAIKRIEQDSQNEIAFVSELTRNSPVGDKITLEKVDKTHFR